MIGELQALEALDAGEVGVWRWEIGTDRLAWSPNLEAIHGLAPGTFGGVFESFAGDIHPADRDRVMAAIGEALRTGGAYKVQYRLPPRADLVERWIEARGRVEMVDGAAKAMTGICHDVTARKRAERDLAERLMQQEAVAELGKFALEADSLQALFDRCVGLLAQTLGLEYAKVLELLPDGRGLLLRAGVGWREGLVGSACLAPGRDGQAGYTLRAESPVVVADMAAETRFAGPSLLHEHAVVSGMSAVIPGPDRTAYGVIGVHAARRREFGRNDVSFLRAVANILGSAVQEADAEARRELLVNELNHRMKNTLASVQSIVHLTMQQAGADAAETRRALDGRLLALAKTHDLLMRGGWRDADLETLVRQALAPYVGGGLAVAGPTVRLSAAAAPTVAMALHELATNAAKYGALSAPGGRVEVQWRASGADGEALVELHWRERGGPPVRPPAKRGFGSAMIERAIAHQLKGRSELSFGADGVLCRMLIPAGHASVAAGA